MPNHRRQPIPFGYKSIQCQWIALSVSHLYVSVVAFQNAEQEQ
jgi:hypothetical protein